MTYEPITTGRGVTRPPIDHEARRYFVYTLSADDGEPLYVGRSCNVAERLRAHISDATSTWAPNAFKATWVPDVRHVTMDGPFTWKQACREEYRQIQEKQPRGNRTGRKLSA